jgi:hypothetical protein
LPVECRRFPHPLEVRILKKLHALLLAGALAALGCSICGAAQVYVPSPIHGAGTLVPGDCLSLGAQANLGWLGLDSVVPCTPAFLTTAYSNATTSYAAVLAFAAHAGSDGGAWRVCADEEDSSTSGTVTFAAGLSAAPTDLWVTAAGSSGTFAVAFT